VRLPKPHLVSRLNGGSGSSGVRRVSSYPGERLARRVVDAAKTMRRRGDDTPLDPITSTYLKVEVVTTMKRSSAAMF
jgi:hypothetical protein